MENRGFERRVQVTIQREKPVPAQATDLLFLIVALGLVALSLSVVLVKNPVRSTLLLTISFLPTSLIFLMLEAPFVGILQILVYSGAIMMLFLFVLMMINPAPKSGEIPHEALEKPAKSGHKAGIFWAIFLTMVGFALLPPVYQAAIELTPTGLSKPGFGGLNSIANLIFKDPMENPLTVSFELISFLILVGIVAAINFSRRRQSESGPTSSGENF